MQLPIRTCDTLTPDGSRRRRLSVFCPRLAASVNPESCRECGYARSIRNGVVDCSPPVETVRTGDDLPAGAVSSAAFTCARRDVPARAVLSLLESQPWPVPIVDAQDQFLGFVSVSQVTGLDLPRRIAWSLPVGEATFGHALAVREGGALRSAIHAMALHQSRSVVLLDGTGIVRGLLTDIDALRAITLARSRA